MSVEGKSDKSVGFEEVTPRSPFRDAGRKLDGHVGTWTWSGVLGLDLFHGT